MASAPVSIYHLRIQLATTFLERGRLTVKSNGSEREMIRLTAQIEDLQREIGGFGGLWKEQLFQDLKLACGVARCVKEFFDQSKSAHLVSYERHLKSGPLLIPQTERGVAIVWDVAGHPLYLQTPLGQLYFGTLAGSPEALKEIGRKVQAAVKMKKIGKANYHDVYAVEKFADFPSAPVSYRSDEEVLPVSMVEELWNEFSHRSSV